LLRWCAHCQTYLGEIEPYDIFEFSHGICEQCLEQQVFDNPARMASASAIRLLHADLQQAIRKKTEMCSRIGYVKPSTAL